MPPRKKGKQAEERVPFTEDVDAEDAPQADATEQEGRRARRGKASAPGPVGKAPPPAEDFLLSPRARADWDALREDMLQLQRRGNDAPGMDVLAEAVVKVFCVHCQSNFSLPWQRKRQYSSTSSGFIVTGNRILTNAHCVEHSASLKVKRRGSDQKYVAHVVSSGAECDVALLSVEDPSFFQGVEPVHFGELPSLQDAVTVVGYPIGGDTMSVTSGVVSRIEVTAYVHGSTELLGVQIDAAINSGNSGGPAFNDRGECVGIAFQSLKGADDAENIGYIIPPPVVLHFLADFERNGRYTGFPTVGIESQRMENPDLRRACNMKEGQKGVMIRRVDPCSPISKVLGPHDIITAFDGTPISNDGTVAFRSGERISFSYLVSQKYVGDVATLRVIRAPLRQQQQAQGSQAGPSTSSGAAAATANGSTAADGDAGGGGTAGSRAAGGSRGKRGAASSGGDGGGGGGGGISGKGDGAQEGATKVGAAVKLEGKAGSGSRKRGREKGSGAAAEPGAAVEEEVKVTLAAPVRLVPFHTGGQPPSYFVHGGLVFTPITVPYLKSEYGQDYDLNAPVSLLNKLFHGFAESPDHQVVALSQVLADSVNLGYEDLFNLKVDSVNGQPIKNMRQLTKIVDGCTSEWLSIVLENNMTVILSAAKAKAATPDILATHCIPSDRSPDLRDA